MKRLLIILAFLPLFGYGQIKVSEMTSASSVGDSDYFLLIQSGSSKKVPYSVFKYNSTLAGTQINDSLAPLRLEMYDVIHDSIVANSGNSVSLGSTGQIPYINPAGTDFIYSSNLLWSGRNLTLNYGTNNILIGSGSGNSTTGQDNVLIGYQSGYNNLSGNYNTFNGYRSGYLNSTATKNTYIGHESGYGGTGGNNVMVGYRTGYASSTGTYNSFLGLEAGRSNTSGSYNTFIGGSAGYATTTGDDNTFIGYQSANSNTTGTENTYLGYRAGRSGTTSSYNLMLGYNAGFTNTANYNNFAGYWSGYTNTTGYENTFFGSYSGYSNSTGYRNTYIGNYAGYNSTGYGNVFLGYQSGQNETGNNKLYISNNSTDTLIYGDFDNDVLHFNADLTIDGNITADNISAISTSQYRIPYANSAGTAFDFSSNFTWNDTTLIILNSTGTGNIFIGTGAGISRSSGNSNTVIGENSGDAMTTANSNTFFGNGSGGLNTNGGSNVLIGADAGKTITSGNQNVMIGTSAGGLATGSSNVFLGNQAGQNETGSNKLYIENSNSASPLIYGEFDNEVVKLVDTVEITQDTTFVRNKLKVTDGVIYVDGRVITPARASAYIASGDEASTTISIADTYYFLKGTFTNVDNCDFQLTGDTLQYIGEEDVNLTLHYACTFGVGQVNTKVTTVVTINDVVQGQSEMERTIAGTSDRGSWSGVATLDLSQNDKIKLEVKADKTGTVTAYKFSTVLE